MQGKKEQKVELEASDDLHSTVASTSEAFSVSPANGSANVGSLTSLPRTSSPGNSDNDVFLNHHQRAVNNQYEFS